jgi:hypothetical protein
VAFQATSPFRLNVAVDVTVNGSVKPCVFALSVTVIGLPTAMDDHA